MEGGLSRIAVVVFEGCLIDHIRGVVFYIDEELSEDGVDGGKADLDELVVGGFIEGFCSTLECDVEFGIGKLTCSVGLAGIAVLIAQQRCGLDGTEVPHHIGASGVDIDGRTVHCFELEAGSDGGKYAIVNNGLASQYCECTNPCQRT